ncbi:hypothetical protein B9Q01_06355 [Candidatus Marsarchaeota G1 archaeon OSP_D]|jgi:hypothetical protein|uniref:Uncharacterized protein n=2 Tax=Candidatus Marsarchaeota group 1 TaxID=2203770 RepID=A0A2R6A9F3_9ARCH|nr:MAG: hypothetical protein B9Q01_06355 [Candidatus Marsarchaeota G1 archaeon OSP_D]PSN88090.1 MAG: hypothetical protein B9Q00_06810 [Candidatus Marsarchaeota G1 archaeon OSP_C]
MTAKLVPLEFEVIDEHWNVYLLSDGTKLKEKHVLLSIARTDTYDALGRPVYQPVLFTFLVPFAPEELRGEPSNVAPSPRALADAGTVAVRVEKVLYEEPNIYKLEDGTVASFRIAITSIKRSLKFFDQFGMPVYIVESTVAPSFEIPKSLWKSEE